MRLLPPDATHTHGSSAFDEYRRRLRRQRRFTNGGTEPTKDKRRRRRDSAEQRGLGCRPKVGTVWVRQDGRREHHPHLRCSRLSSCRTHAAALRAARARSSSPFRLRCSVPPFVNLLRFLRPLRAALRRSARARPSALELNQEPLYRGFVPLRARADHSRRIGHAVLDAKGVRKDRIPPVRVSSQCAVGVTDSSCALISGHR